MSVSFFDGSTRRAPRSIRGLFHVWRTSFAREIEVAYRAYDGGDFIDVGAYQGFYSLLMAPKGLAGDKFVSLEPDSKPLGDLLRNLSTASALFPSVKHYCIPVAVGDGQRSTVTYPMGDAGHPRFLSESSGSGTPTCSIDSLVSALNLKPAFLKIDVEGAELAVVRGALATIDRFRPKIMLELHPKWQPDALAADTLSTLLRDRHYVNEPISADALSSRSLWLPS